MKLADVAAAILDLPADDIKTAEQLEIALKQRFPSITLGHINRAIAIAMHDLKQKVDDSQRRLSEIRENGVDPLQIALFGAALHAHPQWQPAPPPQLYRWIAKGNAPNVDAMIDWFQMNHPADARRIEREYEADD